MPLVGSTASSWSNSRGPAVYVPGQSGQYTPPRSQSQPPSGGAFGGSLITTPHGSVPTGMLAIRLYVAVSITATSLERRHATYSLPPSGVSAMLEGPLPTGTSATIVFVLESSTCTVPPPIALTNTRLPSGCTAIPLGSSAVLTRANIS